MYEDLLLVIKKSNNRVVYRTQYSEWPRMIPASPNYIVRRRQGDMPFSGADWSSFGVVWNRFNLEYRPTPKSEIDEMEVDRMKSRLAWVWLNVLHNANNNTMGMLPGIDLCDTMVELNHLEKERAVVKKLISDELKQYWEPLWCCNTKAEVEKIATELNLQNQLNQAVF